MNGLNIRSKNLMPSPFAKVSLPGLVIGGAVLGYGFGVMFFGDDQLRRLAFNHNQDAVVRTDSRNYMADQKQ